VQVIRALDSVPESAKGAALALGNFDGLHLGHRAIFAETLKRARALSTHASIMTFEPHPREFFAPDAPSLKLMRLDEKLAGFEAAGFEHVLLLPFDKELASTSAGDFMGSILIKALAVKAVITGEDFRFGAKRSGDHATLAAAAAFEYHAVKPVCNDAGVISSSAIRALLSEGKVEQVPHFMGHPFTITGIVAHGDKRGRDLGFPTANIEMNNIFLPRKGVYSVVAEVEKKQYRAVANIGERPTVNGASPRAEVHLFDFGGDIYGKKMRVELHSFLRDEVRFASLDELKAQIARDVEKARQ